MEEYYIHSPKHNYHIYNLNKEFNNKLKESINNDSKDNKISNNNNVISKEDDFPRDRKSNEYKKINSTRTKLLKAIDKEVNKYSKHKTMINSKTTPNYLKSFFNNYRINIKTQQIKSSIETGVSFCSKNINPYIQKLIDVDLQPYIYKYNHHYHKFKRKKKIVLSKQSKNLKLESSFYDSSPKSPISPISETDSSPNRERHLYMISGKLTKKYYFNYLHSLYHTLHNGIYSKKFLSIQKYASSDLYNFTTQFKNFNQNIKRKSSPDKNELINKINYNNNMNSNNNSNSKNIKKASSINHFLASKIIHLVECEQK